MLLLPTKAGLCGIITKKIYGAPIYRTRWEHRAFTVTKKHAHNASDGGIGTAVKDSLEIGIEQMHLEVDFKRGGRITVAE